MRFIYLLFVLVLLSCGSRRPVVSTALWGEGPWPDKIVLVECVNEPGMEAKIIQSFGEFPVRAIRVRPSSYSLYVEAVLGYYYKHQYSEIEYRLRLIPGVINVSIK